MEADIPAGRGPLTARVDQALATLDELRGRAESFSDTLRTSLTTLPGLTSEPPVDAAARVPESHDLRPAPGGRG